jgi:hypothetical protein
MYRTVRSLSVTVGIVGAVALTHSVVQVTSAYAQFSCNTFIAIGIAPDGPAVVGDTKAVTLTLGTGNIQSGTKVTISNVRYELDCNRSFPLDVPCTDQGDLFSYQGDNTITTTCGVCTAGNLNAGAPCVLPPAGPSPGGGCDAATSGDNAGTCVAVTWTSNVPAGGAATNEVVFTPSPAVDIPVNMFGYCSLSFDVKLDNLEQNIGADSDTTPYDIEIVAGFVGTDAVCDNSLPSAGSQSASIPTAPASDCGNGILEPPRESCDDGNTIDDCSNGDNCHNDCTRCLREDPVTIKFRLPKKTDRLFVHGRFEDDHDVDFTQVPVAVRLTDEYGNVIYSAGLPAGAITVKMVKPAIGKTWLEFKNVAVRKDPNGGIARFWILNDRLWYRMKVETYSGTNDYFVNSNGAWVSGRLSDAKTACTPTNSSTGKCNFAILVGQEQFTNGGTWLSSGNGRKLKLPW